jgi:outer membrane protein assembly factor BamB
MSAQQLIEALEERGVLPERLLAKLRTKVAESQPPLSADNLAKFLVQKGHLSAAQATNLLRALSVQPRQISAADVDREPEDGPISSSIFPFGVIGAVKAGSQHGQETHRDDDDDVLELVPIDDDVDLPQHAYVSDRPDPKTAPVVQRKPRAPIEEPIDDRSPLSAISPLSASPNGGGRTAVPAAEPRLAGRDGERVKKKQRRKNQWDSPLLLIGGGALAVLLLCGVVVWLILNWENGDDQLKQARGAAANGAYAQAIASYQTFLAKFPRHPEWSKARVQLAMVRLRSDTESHNFEAALKTAQDELPAIENEPKFEEAHADLAALLPQIARGLADQAEKTVDKPDEVTRWTKAATDTLALCADTKYLPKALRNEGELDAVEETLARVNRRQQSQHDLEEANRSMQAAIDKGDSLAAYAAHKLVLQTHPELVADDTLKAMLVATSKAEQTAVTFVADEHPADTAERPTPWLAALALAHRHSGAKAASTGTFCARVDGAIYGIDVSTGQVLWRRYAGFAAAAAPISVGDDILVVDSRFQELLRLDARTGRLVWRQSFAAPFAAPLTVGTRVYVAAESGRLYVVDLSSGARTGYLQFAQPLRVTPAADRSGERLYVAGDQSSIFSISLKDLKCVGVYYLGHSPGSIRVPPAPVLDKLAIFENDGIATSHLHLLSIDKQGAIARSASDRRLTGLAASPPLVAGRRVVAVTDRGELDVFEVGSGDGDKSLTLVAAREATDKVPLVRYVALSDGAVWIGDTQLTKYSVLPTGNRLPVQTLDNNYAGATFDHPLGAFGTTLIHVRRPPGRAGVVVAAIDAEHGHSLWETELAVPPAASPVVNETARSLAIANVNGDLFRVDDAAIRGRVQDQPLEVAATPSGPPSLTTGVDLGGGRAAFGAPGKSDHLLLYDPSQRDRPARWVSLPSPLACGLTPLGDGLIVPLEVGQIFDVNPTDGKSIASPFQPRLAPGRKLAYQTAGVAGDSGRQFVIADGHEKIYLVALADQPESHLAQVAEANVGPFPIVSQIVVVNDVATAATEGGHLARFQLPSLTTAGETNLPADVVAGPFPIGDLLLVATAGGQLVAVKPEGTIAWTVPLLGGDLAGPPLKTDQGVLIAYHKGVVELLGLNDGKSIRALDLEHPLATGPVRYLNRLVLSAHDGTLLFTNEP